MSNPCLYMFVATHLESMNMGKAMAQASHCANQFIQEWYIDVDDAPSDLTDLVEGWKGVQGFGTQVCLTTDDFQATYDTLKQEFEYFNNVAMGMTVDPTYPFEVSAEIYSMLQPGYQNKVSERNGKILCVRPEKTAFYVFGDRDDPDFASVMRKFKRHP